MRITAAVMSKADSTLSRREIKLEEVELEAPRADEVLVRITHSGVCGTDRGCIHGMEPYPTPGVLGHEGAGIVEEVGKDVRSVSRGDRVMIGFPYCGRCSACRRGEPHYCDHAQALLFSGFRLDGSGGMVRKDGKPVAGRFFQQSSWATHAIALERQLAKVPDGLDLALAAPLGCSISTGAGTIFHDLKPEPGSSIAIFGVGNVGLAAVMAARLTGATKIIAIDKLQARCALARELGATHTMVYGTDTVSELKELTSDRLNFAIESTPGANLVAQAVAALGYRGTCAMVGGAKQTAKVSVNHADVLLHGKRVVGVLGGSGPTVQFLESLMALQLQGRFPLDRLVQHYDFAQVNQAIDDSDAGVTVKPVLRL
jgi:aryl-alcohol dehydrogenase